MHTITKPDTTGGPIITDHRTARFNVRVATLDAVVQAAQVLGLVFEPVGGHRPHFANAANAGSVLKVKLKVSELNSNCIANAARGV